MFSVSQEKKKRCLILFFLPFWQLLDLQAEYHKASYEFLEKNITELKESHTGEQRKRVISSD